MEETFKTLVEKGHVVGRINDKRLFFVLLGPASYMVALENDGCFVVENIIQPVFATDLIGAGFDFLTAPAVTAICEELSAWLAGADRGGADLRLIGERHD
jgi:hypothetical protein